VAHFVGNDEGDAAGLIVFVTEQDDRPALHDTGESLEAGRGQDLKGNHWQTSHPKVSQEIVQADRGPGGMDLATPSQPVDRR
jgi:hypothetical protein